MSKTKKVDKIPQEESVSVKPEEKVVEAPPSEDTPSVEEEPVTEDPAPGKKEVEESVVEVEHPFKNMPGKTKKHKGITVKKRVPKLKDKVHKLYKRMKPGERLTEKEFAKRLKLKDPKDIQAAGIAWHHLFDEGVISDTQFYKPLVRTNR